MTEKTPLILIRFKHSNDKVEDVLVPKEDYTRPLRDSLLQHGFYICGEELSSSDEDVEKRDENAT